MVARVYRKCPGMEIKFVSGKLERDVAQRAISYELNWDLGLDYLNFLVMANLYIPNYLESPINAIRPELTGLAYHHAYNYFFDAAGSIAGNQALFNVFTHNSFYMDRWSTGGVEQRYEKPSFSVVNNNLRMTAKKYFRLGAGDPPIEISDLPFIWFEWALNLMEGLEQASVIAPETKVVLMQAEEVVVDVEGHNVFKGTRYLDNTKLAFGPITQSQILIAG